MHPHVDPARPAWPRTRRYGAGAGTVDALDVGRRQRALSPTTGVVAEACSFANTTVASFEHELIVVSLGEPFS
jgi:hypothetical protein